MLTRSPPDQQLGTTTPGRCWRAPRFLPALPGRHLRRRIPPPPPPAAGPLPLLPDFFSRISVALNSRAAGAIPTLGTQVAPAEGHQVNSGHAPRAPPPPPPRAAAGDVREDSSDPVAGTPSAPSPPQSTLPKRWQHGRASTEET